MTWEQEIRLAEIRAEARGEARGEAKKEAEMLSGLGISKDDYLKMKAEVVEQLNNQRNVKQIK